MISNDESDVVLEYELGNTLFSDFDSNSSPSRSSFPPKSLDHLLAEDNVILRVLHRDEGDYFAILLEEKLFLLSPTSHEVEPISLPNSLLLGVGREMCWINVENSFPALVIMSGKGSSSSPSLYLCRNSNVVVQDHNHFEGPIEIPHRITAYGPHHSSIAASLFASTFVHNNCMLYLVNVVFSDLDIATLILDFTTETAQLEWSCQISSFPSLHGRSNLDCCVYDSRRMVLIVAVSESEDKYNLNSTSCLKIHLLTLTESTTSNPNCLNLTWKDLSISSSISSSEFSPVAVIKHRVQQAAPNPFKYKPFKMALTLQTLLQLESLLAFLSELSQWILCLVLHAWTVFLSATFKAPERPYLPLKQMSVCPEGKIILLLHADDCISVLELEGIGLSTRVRTWTHSFPLRTQPDELSNSTATIQFISNDFFAAVSYHGCISLWLMETISDGSVMISSLSSPLNSGDKQVVGTVRDRSRWLQVPPPIGQTSLNSVCSIASKTTSNGNNLRKLYFLRSMEDGSRTWQLLSMCAMTSLESIEAKLLCNSPLTNSAVQTAISVAKDVEPPLVTEVYRLLWKRWRKQMILSSDKGPINDDSDSDDEDDFAVGSENDMLLKDFDRSRQLSAPFLSQSLESSNKKNIFSLEPLAILCCLGDDDLFVCQQVCDICMSALHILGHVSTENAKFDLELFIQVVDVALECADRLIESADNNNKERGQTYRLTLDSMKDKFNIIQAIVEDELRIAEAQTEDTNKEDGDISLFDFDMQPILSQRKKRTIERRLVHKLIAMNGGSNGDINLHELAVYCARKALSSGLLVSIFKILPVVDLDQILDIINEYPVTENPVYYLSELIDWLVTVNFGHGREETSNILTRWFIARSTLANSCGSTIFAYQTVDIGLKAFEAWRSPDQKLSISSDCEVYEVLKELHMQLFLFCRIFLIEDTACKIDFTEWLQLSCGEKVQLILESSRSNSYLAAMELLKSMYFGESKHFVTTNKKCIIMFFRLFSRNLKHYDEHSDFLDDNESFSVMTEQIFESILVDKLVDFVASSPPQRDGEKSISAFTDVLSFVQASSPSLPANKRFINSSRELLRLVLGACASFNDTSIGLNTMWQLLEHTPKSMVLDATNMSRANHSDDIRVISTELDKIQRALTEVEILKVYMEPPPLSIYLVSDGKSMDYSKFFGNCPKFLKLDSRERSRLRRHRYKIQLLQGVRFLIAPLEIDTKDEDLVKNKQSESLEQCLMAQMCSVIFRKDATDKKSIGIDWFTLATDLQTLCSVGLSQGGSISFDQQLESCNFMSEWAARLLLSSLVDLDGDKAEELYMSVISYFCSKDTNNAKLAGPGTDLAAVLLTMKLTKGAVINLLLHKCREIIYALSSFSFFDKDCEHRVAKVKKILSLLDTEKDNAELKKEKCFMEIFTFFNALEIELVPIQVRMMSPAKLLASVLQERPQSYYSIVNWNNLDSQCRETSDDSTSADSVRVYRDDLTSRPLPGNDFFELMLCIHEPREPDLTEKANKTGLAIELCRTAVRFGDLENLYCLCAYFLQDIKNCDTEVSDTILELTIVAAGLFETEAVNRKTIFSTLISDSKLQKPKFMIDNPEILSFLASNLRTNLIASCTPNHLSKIFTSEMTAPFGDLDVQSTSKSKEALTKIIDSISKSFLSSSTLDAVLNTSLLILVDEALTYFLLENSREESIHIVKSSIVDLEQQLVECRLTCSEGRNQNGLYDDEGKNSAVLRDEFLPPDENMIHKLVSKGFSRNTSKRAVYFTQSESVEKALAWAVEHFSDNDIDFPLALTARGALKSNQYSSRGEFLIEAIKILKRDILCVISGESIEAVDPNVTSVTDAVTPLLHNDSPKAITELKCIPRKNVMEAKNKEIMSNKLPLPKAKKAIKLQLDSEKEAMFFFDDGGIGNNSIIPQSIAPSSLTAPNIDSIELHPSQSLIEPEIAKDDNTFTYEDFQMSFEEVYHESELKGNVLEDVISPLRSTSMASLPAAVEEPSVTSIPLNALNVKIQTLTIALSDVLTDSHVKKLEGKTLSIELMEKWSISSFLEADQHSKLQYLARLYDRKNGNDGDDDSLDGHFLSAKDTLCAELSRDIIQFSDSLEVGSTTDSTKVPQSSCLHCIVLEICLLACLDGSRRDRFEAIESLLAAIFSTSPAYFSSFQEFSLVQLQLLPGLKLNFDHIPESTSSIEGNMSGLESLKSLLWHLAALSLYDQLVQQEKIISEDDSTKSEQTINDLSPYLLHSPDRFLLVLATIYAKVDGRRISLLSLLKKTADSNLNDFSSTHSPTFNTVSSMFLRCKGKADATISERTSLFQQLNAGLKEDIASLRRISRVIGHKEGDCRKLIGTEGLFGSEFNITALSLETKSLNKKFINGYASSENNTMRTAAIRELLFPSYSNISTSSGLPLLRPQNTQEWTRVLGRLLATGPSELLLLCSIGYLVRLHFLRNLHNSEVMISEFETSLTIAARKLRTNHLQILCLILVGVSLIKIDNLLKCSTTELLIDLFSIEVLSSSSDTLTSAICEEGLNPLTLYAHSAFEIMQLSSASGSDSTEQSNSGFLFSMATVFAATSQLLEFRNTDTILLPSDEEFTPINTRNIHWHFWNDVCGRGDLSTFYSTFFQSYLPSLLTNESMPSSAFVSTCAALLDHYSTILASIKPVLREITISDMIFKVGENGLKTIKSTLRQIISTNPSEAINSLSQHFDQFMKLIIDKIFEFYRSRLSLEKMKTYFGGFLKSILDSILTNSITYTCANFSCGWVEMLDSGESGAVMDFLVDSIPSLPAKYSLPVFDEEVLFVLVNLKLTLAVIFHGNQLDKLISNDEEGDWKELAEDCLLNCIRDYHVRSIRSMTSQTLSLPLAVHELQNVRNCSSSDADVASKCASRLYNLYRLNESYGKDFRQWHCKRQEEALRLWVNPHGTRVAEEVLETNVEVLSCLLSAGLWSEYEDVAFCLMPFMSNEKGNEWKTRIQRELNSQSKADGMVDVHFVDQIELLLGGYVADVAWERVHQRLLDSISAATSESVDVSGLYRSLGSVLWALLINRAPLHQLTHSTCWPVVVAALVAIHRCDLSQLQVGGESTQRLSLSQSLTAALASADPTSSQASDKLTSASLGGNNYHPIFEHAVAALSPLRICSSLIVRGLAVEAAQLYWHTAWPTTAGLPFDLVTSLTALLHSYTSSTHNNNESNSFDEAVSVLQEWIS